MSTDSEIIARSLDEPEAFSGIFERHVRPVGAYIARRLGSDAAEDVLSETFLVAFRRRGSYDRAYEDARPWLLGIATRLIKKQRTTEARQWRALQAQAGAAATDDPGHAGSEERMDAERAVRELGPRITALSPGDRDTLLLHAWGDLTYEQIAAALKVPVGTVRSRLNRVRQRLTTPGVAGAMQRTERAGRNP